MPERAPSTIMIVIGPTGKSGVRHPSQNQGCSAIVVKGMLMAAAMQYRTHPLVRTPGKPFTRGSLRADAAPAAMIGGLASMMTTLGTSIQGRMYP
jgi:hypothetical protein